MIGPNDGTDASGMSIFDVLDSIGHVGDHLNEAVEYALHAAEILRIKVEGSAAIEPVGSPHPITPIRATRRGIVVPLTAAQRLQRMRYLAQQVTIDTLDDFVRKDGAASLCPDIYYLLKDHNGGKDPTASDPADRWAKPTSSFLNRTCDCIGGMCWCGGWDRFQPIRFAHIYGGWINTDSMCMECDRVDKGIKAGDPPGCFLRIPYPIPGCYVVCRSGTPGHKIGHIGGVLEAPTGLDLSKRDAWKLITIVDTASRTPKKANALTTAAGWFGTGAYFVVPTMAA